MTNAQLPQAGLRGAVDLSSLVNRQTSTPAPAAGPALVSEASDADFQRVLEQSNTVPVIVEFYAQGIEPALPDAVSAFQGRLVLVTVDANANPQLAQAFQVQQVPTVAAVIAGRPLSLFVGIPPEPELHDVLEQVLQLAQQNGVSGRVDVPVATNAEEPKDQPLPPLHQEAYDAIERGDLAAAVKAYQTAIAQDPRDALAVAGLAQVSLLARLDGRRADEIRSAAADRPADVDAQLAVADLDVSGGHIGDAFDRLLNLFPTLAPVDRDRVRARLIDYFEIVGSEDPRVGPARRRLAALLY